MKKIFSMITVIATVLSLFSVIGYAETEVDYRKIYLDYAIKADADRDNKLNDASGFMLMDLDNDAVPEMLSFTKVTYLYDEDWNPIYYGTPGYENAAHKEYEYEIENAFSIINGKVVEDTPWQDGNRSIVLEMPYLPDEGTEIETEAFSCLQKKKKGPYELISYVPSDGYNFSAIRYGSEGFSYTSEVFDASFYDLYVEASDMPVASIRRYDEENDILHSCEEAMKLLLDKYDGIKHHFNCSDWAMEEIERADLWGLIPEKMLGIDMKEEITREEFAAIAVKLYEKLTKGNLADEIPDYSATLKTDFERSRYKEEVMEAYYAGITKGTGAGSSEYDIEFSPDLNISREQLATMLYRTIEKYGDFKANKEELTDIPLAYQYLFYDDSEISDYACIPVYYMHYKGIIKGTDEYHFNPGATATREQAIILSLRTLNALKGTKALKIDESVLAGKTAVSLGELIPDMGDEIYTIDELSKNLGIRFKRTSEIVDLLGEMNCQSFDWKDYYFTVICNNEESYISEENGERQLLVSKNNTVMISDNKIHGIRLNDENLTLKANEVYNFLNLRMDVSRVADIEVEWTSSDENIVKILENNSYNAVLYAENAGVATITATVNDKGEIFAAQCTVTVEG